MSKQLARNVLNGFNRQPALLALAYANELVDSIQQLSKASHAEENVEAKMARDQLVRAYGYESSSESKPFAFSNGVAFIPISGMLINRFSYSWGWVTGYNFIRDQLNAALADEDVSLIVFDCNSGGGMVAGCFELCDDIYKSRSVKPSLAVVDSASYSACYALASSASKLVVTPSGGVGSIGVVAMHVDWSDALKEAGINVTFIYSGDHKVDGNPYEKLPKSVKADIQKSVDTTRQKFVDVVARNRKLEPKAVYDTEAQVYDADTGLELGLVDAIATPIEAVRSFTAEYSGNSLSTTEAPTMSTTEQKPAAGGNESQEAASTEKKETTAATEKPTESAASVDAVAAARAEERARIAAITGHEAAKDKPLLAAHLATATDMTVEAAVGVLKAAQPEAAATPAKESAFITAMNSDKHPAVGADADRSAGGEGASLAQQILASQSALTGMKPATH